MYLPAVALLDRQHGLLASRQLLDLGCDRITVDRLVRTGRLVRVRRGVYADAEAWAADPHRGQPVMRIRAAAMVLRSTAYVFSHDSAAILLSMGAPAPTTALVHVTRHKVHGDAVRAGIKHHRAPFDPADVREVDGLRVLPPARTALDLAREHGRSAGLAGCDAALRLGSTRDDLRRVLATMHCWPGTQVMRWCAQYADGGAESYLESLGRALVLELGIGTPQTQFGLSDGRREVWCDLRVDRHVFEVDGFDKYPAGAAESRAALRREKTRQDFIGGFKIGVSRITAYDCGAGHSAALARLHREFSDTCQRFGTSLDDLRPYVLPASRRHARL
ncbi:type IV toxin-antitoxin system AbiEi family antitoxin domain-containing protein [Nocardioides sp. SYSU D00065]|uniref:type IV toxin-antitoxin system AbiEi family antitoxin domain-containing protein n=1 Tax=Nocardioides sp. SYSU D00065 TaxID=2817378 RepID=UPI001B312499|nr:type IV toxin-antitoxin system AbiEi family antitoxin domain-containing protein [Nocardioides sp. SYSU D00065]